MRTQEEQRLDKIIDNLLFNGYLDHPTPWVVKGTRLVDSIGNTVIQVLREGQAEFLIEAVERLHVELAEELEAQERGG